MAPWIVLATIIAYFCLLFLVSYLANRKSKDAGFFADSVKAPWYIVAFATMGAAISGVTFVSVPGMVEAKGFSYLQMQFGFIIGYIVIAFLLVPMFYKRNLISIYGYLAQRFGANTHKSGAWFFFVSKMLGAAVRFYVVCMVLQALVFNPLGIPFEVNVLFTVALIWLYTKQGGVKTVIWTDTLKSFCLVASVVLCIVLISNSLGYSFGGMVSAIADDPNSQLFFFDNPKEGTYFWKQFIAGIFMVIATCGLDQDMMQRNLACKNFKESQKNMIVSAITQVFVVGLFLALGVLLYQYAGQVGIKAGHPDDLFGLVAAHNTMPLIVGILFILGLVSAAYSAAGSALTALTTSFTVDILKTQDKEDKSSEKKKRELVHVAMAAVMALVIIVFYYLNSQDAISAVYAIASYTYGPILGLFVFGMFIKNKVRDNLVPYVCIASPIICYFVQDWLFKSFGYVMSFELLLLNALVTVVGLALIAKGEKVKDA